jgi:hypothetical protein
VFENRGLRLFILKRNYVRGGGRKRKGKKEK